MNKKILIGSIIAVVILLLMPSIPALQQKTIAEGIKQDIQEKLDTITIDDLKDISVLGNLKYPILQFFVIMFITLRTFQITFLSRIDSFLNLISDEPYAEWPNLYDFLSKRIFFLYATYTYWITYWQMMSDLFDWNWSLEPPNN